MSDELDELFERSKDDHAMIVGSDIRIAIAAARRAEAALSEAQQELKKEKEYAIFERQEDERCIAFWKAETQEYRTAAEAELRCSKELSAQVAQLQATLQEQFNAARSLAETVVKMDADKAQLQATICTLHKKILDLAYLLRLYRKDHAECTEDSICGCCESVDAALAALNEAKQ